MAKQQQSSKVRKQSKTAMKSSKASTVSHKTKITSKPKKTVFEDQDIEEHVEKLDNIDADDDIEMHHADKCDRIEGDNGENGQHSVIHPEGDDAETPKAKKAKVHSGSNDSHAQNGDGTKKPSRDEQKRLLKERKVRVLFGEFFNGHKDLRLINSRLKSHTQILFSPPKSCGSNFVEKT
jgi:hypothetical protein